MSPAGGFGGFQANAPTSADTIDASTPFIAAGDGDLELLKTSIEQLGISPNYADSSECVTCLVFVLVLFTVHDRSNMEITHFCFILLYTFRWIHFLACRSWILSSRGN